MPITNFLGFSTTPASNVDVNGISIQGTAPVSNFDNAVRELVAILRRDIDGRMTIASKSSGYTAVANDNNTLIRFSAAATLSLTAAATLGAGWHALVMADGGAVVVDPNASETINGASTITIPDGYSTLVICDGTNFLALEDYSTTSAAITAGIASKLDILQASVDVASATTTDIGAAASQNVRVTGTTTITGLGTVAAGTFRRVRFAAALTLTHNATSLILPGAANITTAAGDIAEFISEGSGNWRCVDYTSAAAQRTWQNVTASRANNTTYTNSTGRTISVQVAMTSSSNGNGITVAINGTNIMVGSVAQTAGQNSVVYFEVPAGATYLVTISSFSTLSSWVELR